MVPLITSLYGSSRPLWRFFCDHFCFIRSLETEEEIHHLIKSRLRDWDSVNIIPSSRPVIQTVRLPWLDETQNFLSWQLPVLLALPCYTATSEINFSPWSVPEAFFPQGSGKIASARSYRVMTRGFLCGLLAKHWNLAWESRLEAPLFGPQRVVIFVYFRLEHDGRKDFYHPTTSRRHNILATFSNSSHVSLISLHSRNPPSSHGSYSSWWWNKNRSDLFAIMRTLFSTDGVWKWLHRPASVTFDPSHCVYPRVHHIKSGPFRPDDRTSHSPFISLRENITRSAGENDTSVSRRSPTRHIVSVR